MSGRLQRGGGLADPPENAIVHVMLKIRAGIALSLGAITRPLSTLRLRPYDRDVGRPVVNERSVVGWPRVARWRQVAGYP